MAIEVRPATVFADVRTMVGPNRPDANVCWCLSYRIPSAQNQSLAREERGRLVETLVSEDPPPGVLAYEGDEVVGWAGVHPRADTAFARNRKIPHVDDLDVWSVWCVRVRPGHRGQGISHALLAGSVEFARSHGAPAIEGYPVDNRGEKVDLTMAYVGTVALFEAAGFERAAETTSVLNGFPRVLMRARRRRGPPSSIALASAGRGIHSRRLAALPLRRDTAPPGEGRRSPGASDRRPRERGARRWVARRHGGRDCAAAHLGSLGDGDTRGPAAGRHSRGAGERRSRPPVRHLRHGGGVHRWLPAEPLRRRGRLVLLRRARRITLDRPLRRLPRRAMVPRARTGGDAARLPTRHVREAQGIVAENRGGAVVDLSDYFCNASTCPAVIGATLVYSDEHHVTATFSRSLAGVLEERLASALAAGG